MAEGVRALVRMVECQEPSGSGFVHEPFETEEGRVRARLMSLFFAAAAAGAAGPAHAHHSLSMIERAKTVTVSGVVKEFAWGNPHVWIALETSTPDGMVESWSIEGGSPMVLARSGWRPSAVKPGDHISIGVHPRKDGKTAGYLADEEPLTVNGRVLVTGLHQNRGE